MVREQGIEGDFNEQKMFGHGLMFDGVIGNTDIM